MREVAARAEAEGCVDPLGPQGARDPPAGRARQGPRGAHGCCATPTLDAALYVGDDRTDLDAFRGLRELVAEGAPRHGACASACARTRRPPSSRPRPTCSSTARRGVRRLLEALLAEAACASSTSSGRRCCCAPARATALAVGDRRSARRDRTTTTCSCSSPRGWWLVAALIGAWLGRRAQADAADRARCSRERAGRRRRCPSSGPARSCSTACGRCSSRRSRAGARRRSSSRRCRAIAAGLRDHLGARVAPPGGGGARRSRSATASTFYVERTSPLRPMQLVRAPGFRRERRTAETAA